jgi:hypothetical protein
MSRHFAARLSFLAAGLGLFSMMVSAQDPQQYPQQQPYPQQPQQPYPPPQQPYPQTQYPSQQPYPQQYPQAPPPPMAPQQLDQLVQRIALYPDGLLTQILTAATFYPQIPDAAGWANEHSYLRGPDLAAAIQADNLPWDPSVLALLPFPNVLNMMAQDMGWTQTLGNAVLAQRPDLMDAVQRMRQEAYDYGYLRNNPYDRVVVAGPEDIEIVPVNPDYYYVPAYSPYVVFARPRPGFFVGGAIRFGPEITIGAAFAPFGWGHPRLDWRSREIVIDNHPWARGWNNRGAYVHPYATPYHRPAPGARVEHHEIHNERRDHHDDHRDQRRDDHH